MEERKQDQIISEKHTNDFAIPNRGTLISFAVFVDPVHINNKEVPKRILAGVQRPHGTALIACHLPKYKPPVGSRLT